MLVPLALRFSTAPFLSFTMRQPIATIGRSSNCSFVVSDSSVSRRHAELRVADEGVSVSDLGSRNGTFVDDVHVQCARVIPGQIVRFGNIAFTVASLEFFEDETDPSPTSACPAGRVHPCEKLLSEAQRRVFEMLLGALPEKAIAKRLKLSQHTVHNHTRAVFSRLGVHSRAELMARLMNTADVTAQGVPRQKP